MFVIYNSETTILFDPYKKYARRQDAQAVLTKLKKAGHYTFYRTGPDKWVVGDYDEFKKIEKTETVYNLMSGAPVVQSVNTPLCCDVSSETYWSL